MIPVVIGALSTVTKRFNNGTRGFGNKRTSGENPNDSIKIAQNTEKSPRDLRRFAVSQTPVEDHLQTMV